MTKGRFTNGLMTCKASANIAQGQLLKMAADGSVAPCTAATDEATHIALISGDGGERISCAVLGNAEGTQLILATAAVATGDYVNPLGAVAAAGDIAVGLALEGAAAGELFNAQHFAAREL